MNLIFGFVKLFKSLNISNNNNDLRVYLHLLINANYKNTKYKDYNISKGQLITSYISIADALGLSRKQVITAIQHLRDNNYIKWQGVPQNFSICTICQYDLQYNDNAYNFVKLYRSIQAADWYADDVAARLYYYILLHTADGLRTKRGNIIKELAITPHDFYVALDRLATADAVKYRKEGTEYIISTYADYVDNDNKPSTQNQSATTTNISHNHTNKLPTPSSDIFDISDDEAADVMKSIFGQ